MVRASCRISVIFIILICSSPVEATPITILEFQKDKSIAETILWKSFAQIQQTSRPPEIERWERAKNELAVGNVKAAPESNMTIPESGSLILLGIGLAGIAALMKKTSKTGIKNN